ncbi:unannotated protein [freshwater metagenome]|uniref:Unannotated protein n=1 Tax=freshwater metagenome TaxID=449393 RepID=A0A6J6FHF3_9ZZZZ
MRAHADERRGHVFTDIAQLVAHSAGGSEHGLAVGQIAGLFDLGREFGDDFVLRLRTGIELFHHRIRLFSDIFVRMRAQTRDVARADVFRIHFAVRDGSQQRERRLGPLEDGVEGLRS